MVYLPDLKGDAVERLLQHAHVHVHRFCAIADVVDGRCSGQAHGVASDLLHGTSRYGGLGLLSQVQHVLPVPCKVALLPSICPVQHAAR
jgi:hypothetical protein